MQSPSFTRIARARARDRLDALSRAPASGQPDSSQPASRRNVLSDIAHEAASACIYAGMSGAAVKAARAAKAGPGGLLRAAERIRILDDADKGVSTRPSGDCPYAETKLVRGAIPLPRRVLDEARRQGTGLYGLRFGPADLEGSLDELISRSAELAKVGRLLGLYALVNDGDESPPEDFSVIATGKPPSRAVGASLLPLDGFPVATRPVLILSPGETMPEGAKEYRLVDDLPNVKRRAKRSRRPEKAKEKVGLRRVTFPIGLKLVLVVSILLVASLAAMNALASYFFLSDASIRVEENNYTLAQVAAIKVEDDARGLADRARLALDLSGGNAEAEAAIRFFAANTDLLYVSVPGLAQLPNRGAIAALGLDEAAIAARALEASTGEGVRVFNASPAIGAPALGVAIPYREGGFEGSLVAISSSERYAEVLKPRGIVTAWAVNDRGQLILHADTALLLAGPDYSREPIVATLQAAAADNGQTRYRDTEGREFLGSYRRLDFGGIGVVAVAPVDKAFEAVEDIQRRNLLIMGAVLSLAMVLTYFFSRSLTRPVGDLMDAAHQIEAGRFLLDIRPRTRDELGALTATFSEMGKGLAEREKIKEAFGKFVNKTVAELATKGEIKLGGERKAATILFSDIRGFTSISETMQPEQVVEFLNQYLTRMVGCVDASGGAVDKFIGDAIMAVWGVPVSTGRDPAAAVDAALAMRASLREFNKGRGGPGKPMIRIGCGINSGAVLAGQIGSTERMEYTVIGDAVNLASRVEALNKPFGTDILVSEYCLSELGGAYAVEPMPMIEVKGKSEPLRVYAVLRRSGDASGPKTLSELRAMIGAEDRKLDKAAIVDDDEKKYKILGKAREWKGS